MALVFRLDDYDLPRAAQLLAGFGQERFGYVVTPNVDHVIRCYEDSDFRGYYGDASYVLLDSRFLAHILRLTRGLRLPVCTGSDMTGQLFGTVMRPEDNVVLIGAREAQARQLVERFGLRSLHHYNPPMGFIQVARTGGGDAAVRRSAQPVPLLRDRRGHAAGRDAGATAQAARRCRG